MDGANSYSHFLCSFLTLLSARHSANKVVFGYIVFEVNKYGAKTRIYVYTSKCIQNVYNSIGLIEIHKITQIEKTDEQLPENKHTDIHNAVYLSEFK